MKVVSFDDSDVITAQQPIVEDKKKNKKKKNKKDESEESTPVKSEPDMATNGHSENGDVEEEELPEGDFSRFRIAPETIKKLHAKKITQLFPIQAKTFDDIYEGHDVVAQARTGTGKTLSFALPIVQKLQKKDKAPKGGRTPKVLVMAPTRELARQVSEDFEAISDSLSILCVYGGTPYGPQISAMRHGLDVVVGTPGRLQDHVQSGNLDISKLKFVVLDEVDMMLDMGFADTVDTILQSAYTDEAKKPQTLLFSATVPPWVEKTAKKYMKDWKTFSLIGRQETQTSTTVEHLAIKCSYFDRAATIGDVLQVYSGSHGRAIIFCQTKRDADQLAVHSAIKQDAHVLHGDIPQDKREMVLKSFKEGKYNVLITTDVAARGLDIPEIDLVIQCNPPKDVDSYIHRAGRTGRAGRSGTCLCFYKPQEENSLNWVAKTARINFKKIGAPTTKDIIKTSATDAAKSLETVPEETLQYFRDSAEKLLANREPVDVLSAALAIISGSTKIVSRSLISSSQGYTTYIFSTNMELRGTGYVWRSLEKQIPDDKEKIMRMRMCKDKTCVVFDLPSELDQLIEEKWTDGKFDTLKKATELPELLESASRGGFNGPSNGYQGGRGFQGGGFRGGRGNSRGGGRGRGGGGGFNGHQNFNKRKSFDLSAQPQNKKIKFD
ncbi:hypothetical protein ScPMuIL_004595 [Solemya velum]